MRISDWSSDVYYPDLRPGRAGRRYRVRENERHTRWIDERLNDLTAPVKVPDTRLWKAVDAVLFVVRERSDGAAEPWSNRDVFTNWRLGLGGGTMEAGQREIGRAHV